MEIKVEKRMERGKVRGGGGRALWGPYHKNVKLRATSEVMTEEGKRGANGKLEIGNVEGREGGAEKQNIT